MRFLTLFFKVALSPMLGLYLVAQESVATDWPQFRGPNRDGIWNETGILESFPVAAMLDRRCFGECKRRTSAFGNAHRAEVSKQNAHILLSGRPAIRSSERKSHHPSPGTSCVSSERRMVEAGGVEPPSLAQLPAATTCLVRRDFSAVRWRPNSNRTA